MESIQIYLNSRTADKYINGISDCEYLLPLIEIPDGFHIYLSVVDVLIPFSYYNINNSNNIFKYSFDGIAITTLTITNGNYNITNLVNFLKANMTGFTIIYNNIQNKITFTHSTTNFMIMSNSTCSRLIGFTENITYASSSLSLTSNICVDIYSVRNIQINSNLITYNINKTQKNNLCILCSIPVTSQPFGLIEYINRTNFRTNLFLNRISAIKIQLTDDNGNLLDLNGCHYTITLQLDVVNFVS